MNNPNETDEEFCPTCGFVYDPDDTGGYCCYPEPVKVLRRLAKYYDDFEIALVANWLEYKMEDLESE